MDVSSYPYARYATVRVRISTAPPPHHSRRFPAVLSTPTTLLSRRSTYSSVCAVQPSSAYTIAYHQCTSCEQSAFARALKTRVRCSLSTAYPATCIYRARKHGASPHSTAGRPSGPLVAPPVLHVLPRLVRFRLPTSYAHARAACRSCSTRSCGVECFSVVAEHDHQGESVLRECGLQCEADCARCSVDSPSSWQSVAPVQY
ncbi:hypothetical protein PYCCODRAFT_749779 [Trametes coccinea BRFM310]|uniref:Uncharacterized protein n=1 Tax=Trametes coccinea (strain BRFM310) TaxID=1353009 RepID=A0A1Y2IFC8_TRAC3|nr:hypothetical protein PYCCODRAFT_749779 [Trametes coccinea BRFM310]